MKIALSNQPIIIFLTVLLILVSDAHAQVKVIFDTDIGPDWDDVGATATLHALANMGETEILAMMVSSGGHSATWGPPCLDAFNTYYDRPDIPIGVAQNGPEFGSSYNQQIAEEFPQDLGTGNAWDAVELYRKVLSEQPDSSVVIVTVGFITNLEDLLKSEADDYSSLNGMELVKKKVDRWVCMGGGYPSSGGEFNFNRDAEATLYVVENWPKPVLFSGAEIGSPIQTGAKLALTPESNPIRRAYELAGGYVGSTRSSWDQTAVLAAVRDPLLYWDLETTGYCHVFSNGANEWRTSPDKNHTYLIARVSNAEMVEIIDNLMADLQGMPEISITSPVNGTLYNEGADIPVEAVASDSNGQVSLVEFYARNNKIGEDSTLPYSVIWSDVSIGGYYLTARVTDDDGNTVSSKGVKIYVGEVDQTFVGHWMFEEDASDSSDHGNDGVLSGNPEFVEGKMGDKALEFKTSQDYVTIPESPDFSTAGFTLAAWVRIPQTIPSGWRTILEHNRWGNNWFGLWKSANGNRFHFRWGNQGKATSDFSTLISADTWYHVAGTYDSTTQSARLYLNGSLDRLIENADAPHPVLSEIRIGLNMDGTEEFDGVIDDVRVYKRVLDDAEIQELSNVSSFPNHDDTENSLIPNTFSLSNYPNPFNPSTTIHFGLPVATHVLINIYDITGHLIENVVNEDKPAGFYKISFSGHMLASGVYFCRLSTPDQETVSKMIIVK